MGDEQITESNAYCSPDNLLRMVRSGAPDALDRLTRCYGDRLLSAGVRHCRPHEEAEAAVQDALTIAIEKLDTFRASKKSVKKQRIRVHRE
jgi:DNA-directed RNA polymerase specialized sigma24 family protein